MTRGEVRWYKFSRPDKTRPVLVLTRDSALQYLNEVTVAPITTRIRDIPSTVVLGKHDGLPRDCVVTLDHLQTVARKRLGPAIAKLSPERMREVARAIRFSLDLSSY